MPIYRLYIDETGHHNYPKSEGDPERYLGLTGIIVERNVYDDEVRPRIERLRSPFYTDHDLRPPLHLTSIMSATKDFAKLKDPRVQATFDAELLSLVNEVDYKIISVVIDKSAHQDKYVTPEHPYHYCLTCLLERYVKFLKNQNAKGDVIAEARGKKEDSKLKEVYEKFYTGGTYYASTVDIQAHLSSKDIKLKNKSDFIQGLEFADLIALSSKIDVLHTYGHIESLNPNFTTRIISAIQPKYYSGALGTKGNGKKFL